LKQHSDPVKLAVVGAGMMGQRHIQFMDATGVAELVAIVDPASAGHRLAESRGVACFDTAQKMLDEANVEGVIISTPTIHHLEPTLASLDAGCHVLVEKPIAATLHEALQIQRKSEQCGREVLVGHHRRYNPAVVRAKQLIEAGAIGDLLNVSGQWTVLKHVDYFSSDWRRDREAGPVLTNLIHEIDYLRFMCGEIASLSAEISSHARNFAKEDSAALVFRFENGALGTFIISDASPSPWSWEQGSFENPTFPKSQQNSIRFMGSKGALEFPNLRLWQHENPDDPSVGHWHYPLKSTEIEFSNEDAFHAQCRHFCSVIRGAEKPCITARDGTNTLRATLAVFDSANTGQRVELNE
jgi:predicted dehydrogenase